MFHSPFVLAAVHVARCHRSGSHKAVVFYYSMSWKPNSVGFKLKGVPLSWRRTSSRSGYTPRLCTITRTPQRRQINKHGLLIRFSSLNSSILIFMQANLCDIQALVSLDNKNNALHVKPRKKKENEEIACSSYLSDGVVSVEQNRRCCDMRRTAHFLVSVPFTRSRRLRRRINKVV